MPHARISHTLTIAVSDHKAVLFMKQQCDPVSSVVRSVTRVVLEGPPTYFVVQFSGLVGVLLGF